MAASNREPLKAHKMVAGMSRSGNLRIVICTRSLSQTVLHYFHDKPVAVVGRLGIDLLKVRPVGIPKGDQDPIAFAVAENQLGAGDPWLAVGRAADAVIGQQGIVGRRWILAQEVLERPGNVT